MLALVLGMVRCQSSPSSNQPAPAAATQKGTINKEIELTAASEKCKICNALRFVSFICDSIKVIIIGMCHVFPGCLFGNSHLVTDLEHIYGERTKVQKEKSSKFLKKNPKRL